AAVPPAGTPPLHGLNFFCCGELYLRRDRLRDGGPRRRGTSRWPGSVPQSHSILIIGDPIDTAANHHEELVESRLPCHPASRKESEICFDAGDLSRHPLAVLIWQLHSGAVPVYLMLPLRR
ncbi:unnamed protein product, partial [Urochloa humidicola]